MYLGIRETYIARTASNFTHTLRGRCALWGPQASPHKIFDDLDEKKGKYFNKTNK